MTQDPEPGRPALPTAATWAVQYLLAAAIFGAMDSLWLTTVAGPLYEEHLGDRLVTSPDVTAAAAFYAIYVFGMVWLVIHPAVEAGGGGRALRNGAVLGLVAYATWSLTNLAVLEGFPHATVVPELAWGTFVTATTCWLTFVVSRRLRARRRGA